MKRNIIFATIASLLLISCTSKDETTSDPVEFVIQTRIDTVWVDDFENATMTSIIVESQDTIFIK